VSALIARLIAFHNDISLGGVQS